MSLKQRMKPEFYGDLVDAWRVIGLSEEVIATYIGKSIEEATKLHEGICPQCGAAIARYVDYTRQQGSKGDMPGAWVQYRCSTQPPIGELRAAGVCDFMIDLVEGVAAS